MPPLKSYIFLVLALVLSGCGAGLRFNPSALPIPGSGGASQTLNEVPTIALSAPAGNSNFLTIGSSVDVEWDVTDDDTDVSVLIYRSHSTTGNCEDGELIQTLTSVPVGNGTHSVDLTNYDDGIYYFCAIVNDSVNPAMVSAFSGRVVVYPASTCTWVGDTSTGWTTASNWVGCPGAAAPITTDSVLILEHATNQPILAANTTIVAFASGKGGGTLTVNSGVTLTLSSSGNDFASDVALQGATAACTTCRFTSTYINIGNDATLTMKSGIRAASNGFYVGSASQSAHLVTRGGATESEWPVITASGSYFDYLDIQGTASKRSSIDINGLVAEKFSNTYFDDMRFLGSFEIKRFDNFAIYQQWTTAFGNAARILFSSCTNSIFSDVNWVIHFNAFSETNISISGCTVNSTLNPGFAGISVTGSGFNQAALEADTGNILSWPTRNTCVWNTSGSDRSWTNPANWTACNSGYPTGNDLVSIGAGGNQPQISSHLGIWGFSGAGGGTIEFTGGYGFQVNNSTFNTDITFIGPSNGSTAVIRNVGAYINSNGKLTLGQSMGLETYGYIVGLNVGSNGTFVTNGGTDPRNWPYLNLAASSTTTAGVNVDGTSGSPATVSINGLVVYRVRHGFTFVDNYQIDNFDNIVALGEYSTISGLVNFSTCTGGVVNDTNWENIGLKDPVGAFNIINASNATCSAAPYAITYDFYGPGPLNKGDAYSMFTPAVRNCAGASDGTYCWYLGTPGESCTSVCGANGGTSIGHYMYSGYQGVVGNCTAALTAVGATGGPSASNYNVAGDFGCIKTGSTWRRYSNTNTSDIASSGSLERVCSCRQ